MRQAFTKNVPLFLREEALRQEAGVQEQIVLLSAEEAAIVDLQTRRLLRAQRLDARRKRAQGIPPPPAPGKIAYAVYQ